MLMDITKEEDGLKVEVKTFFNQVLRTEKTYIIQERDPYILWDMLYDALGYPHRTRERRDNHITDVVMIKKEEANDLEEELARMPSKEIIKKVEEDTGHKIKISVKSKKNVIRHALRAYGKDAAIKPAKSSEWISLGDCIEGHLYKISARNGHYGIFHKDQAAFTLARQKFDEIFLFDEFHWDTGEPHGTVKPLEDLGLFEASEGVSVLDHLKGLEGYRTCRRRIER